MPWKGVTVSEERERFLEDYQLNYYSVSELAEASASRGRQPTSRSPGSRSWALAATMNSPCGSRIRHPSVSVAARPVESRGEQARRAMVRAGHAPWTKTWDQQDTSTDEKNRGSSGFGSLFR